MISRTEYRRIYAKRPEKFNTEDVLFVSKTEDDKPCCGCWNWFYSPAMSKSVCQIYRPEDDGDVPALGSCIAWTLDNETFPKMDK